MIPKLKLEQAHLEAARKYKELKASNPIAAAALINAQPFAVVRGLEAMRNNEQPEPEPTPPAPKDAA